MGGSEGGIQKPCDEADQEDAGRACEHVKHGKDGRMEARRMEHGDHEPYARAHAGVDHQCARKDEAHDPTPAYPWPAIPSYHGAHDDTSATTKQAMRPQHTRLTTEWDAEEDAMRA